MDKYDKKKMKEQFRKLTIKQLYSNLKDKTNNDTKKIIRAVIIEKVVIIILKVVILILKIIFMLLVGIFALWIFLSIWLMNCMFSFFSSARRNTVGAIKFSLLLSFLRDFFKS